ncbi:PepSY-associated TM helix domain-containing protein [Colwellia sp. E2M01]|uniref:PepSY-associated TM helix domain-containing protein n=1 Tax=Colwellia sp. E2M01 TaxID=2841561 RepID=UPI001C095CE0|nr:PepSY-associated TM helix domain-containing protein [Colwellia sp. E2M01]MBU2872188.1 PepSY domain-containing protein [Colwellia sp. E2M01]
MKSIVLTTLSRRKYWKKIHLYLALIACIPLLLIAITGIILAFDTYIRGLNNPQTIANPNNLPLLPMAKIINKAQQELPSLTLHMAVAPKSSWHPYLIYASKQQGKKRPFFRLYINPYDGDITLIENSPSLPLTFIKRIHRNLLVDQPGRYIVAAVSTILMLLGLIGVYLWWPMRKRTIVYALKKKQRLSLHNLLGVIALPLIIVITLTGITVTFKKVVIPFVYTITQSPPLLEPPNSRQKVNSHKRVNLVLSKASEQYPLLTITSISLPKPNTFKPFVVQLRSPNDVHPMGWKKAFYDGNTGEKIGFHDTAKQSIAAQYNQLWYPLHTGEILGFTGAIIWTLVCISIIYLTYSGLLLWNTRRKKVA